ncbi:MULTISPECIES: YutD family protein [Enterococcus]|uniref:Transcriptional regulator n=1 Tax=Enterococcus sulfureus ATCC 49903 TaxID=1140003 RepID=S0P4U8_9ENTE|nr:YutD family protein [Enterococcus sulfureus]EOT45495.1 hypothetical protein OMY_02074 [Enterococcus sulfureus ATCC 49903]EOT83386.1 hypothetical protein I573_01936 [Enterococcus sulfureus ATCC 49903]
MSEENQLTDDLTAILEEIVEEPTPEQKTAKGTTFERVNETDILLSGRLYRVVADYRQAFDLEKVANRYSEVLSRYDFIVGDWGYDQLRLKGFFDVTNKRALPDQRIDTLEDYLYEYCNFGCAYFVIERVGHRKQKNTAKKQKKKQTKSQAHVAEKKAPVKKTTPKIKNTTKKTGKQSPGTTEAVKQKPKEATKKFTIRKREE